MGCLITHCLLGNIETQMDMEQSSLCQTMGTPSQELFWTRALIMHRYQPGFTKLCTLKQTFIPPVTFLFINGCILDLNTAAQMVNNLVRNEKE